MIVWSGPRPCGCEATTVARYCEGHFRKVMSSWSQTGKTICGDCGERYNFWDRLGRIETL